MSDNDKDSTSSSESEKFTVDNIPGVGPAMAAKLRKAGFYTFESLAIISVNELSEYAEIGERTASRIIELARRQLDLQFQTADQVLETRNKILKITTGSESFDHLLGGGVEARSITELFGEFRSGKTQVCLQLALTTALPEDDGGVGASVLYIDTEGTFRPERIIQMAQRYDISEAECKELLKKIIVGRAHNTDHQIALVAEAGQLIPSKNIKLLIVDSLTSHFRSEYVGRSTLVDRQQKLNKHIHQLLRLSEIYDMAIVVTNQVAAKIDNLVGGSIAPIGGHIVAHSCTTRVYLRKSKADRRIARIIDSPHLPENETVFLVTKGGIQDIKGEYLEES
jgi:DNA repair protein RadA